MKARIAKGVALFLFLGCNGTRSAPAPRPPSPPPGDASHAGFVARASPTNIGPPELTLEDAKFQTTSLDGSGPSDYPSVAVTGTSVRLAIRRIDIEESRLFEARDGMVTHTATLPMWLDAMRSDERGTIHFIGHTGLGMLGEPYRRVAGTLPDTESAVPLDSCKRDAAPLVVGTRDGAAAAYNCNSEVHLARSGPWRVVQRRRGFRPVGLAYEPANDAIWMAIEYPMDEEKRGTIHRVVGERVDEIPLPAPKWTPSALSVGADGTVWASFSFFDERGPRLAIARWSRESSRWELPQTIPDGYGAPLLLAQGRGSVLVVDAEGLHRLTPDGRWTSRPFPDERVADVRDAVLDSAGNIHIVYAIQLDGRSVCYAIGRR